MDKLQFLALICIQPIMKIGDVAFGDMLVNRHNDRHTDRNAHHNTPLHYRGGVKIGRFKHGPNFTKRVVTVTQGHRHCQVATPLWAYLAYTHLCIRNLHSENPPHIPDGISTQNKNSIRCNNAELSYRHRSRTELQDWQTTSTTLTTY